MRRLARPYWIPPNAPPEDFPPVAAALTDPDGLLAVGGDLSPPRLLYAYQHGIFPWYNRHQPILWWAPNPRMVLFLPELKISRSLTKVLRKQTFSITFDQAFADVVRHCATTPRPFQDGTWITLDMYAAYLHLHELGYAHSVECWRDGKLVGGLYGLALRRIFCGESMFSHCSNASKVALVSLVRQLQAWNYELIDAQVYSPHLESLGAREIPRPLFTNLLAQWGGLPDSASTPPKKWPKHSNY
jgi:leucyl/phenylalanyl-tRNA---protein transferase